MNGNIDACEKAYSQYYGCIRITVVMPLELIWLGEKNIMKLLINNNIRGEEWSR